MVYMNEIEVKAWYGINLQRYRVTVYDKKDIV